MSQRLPEIAESRPRGESLDKGSSRIKNRIYIYVWISISAAATYGFPLIVGSFLGDNIATICAIFSVVVATAFFFTIDARLFFLYWISIVLLQNVASGFWHAGVPGDIPLAVTESKSIALVVAAILAFQDILYFLSRNRFVLLGAVLYLVGLLMNFGSLDAVAVANMRNFMTPAVLLLLAASVAQRYGTVEKSQLIKMMLVLSTFWLSLGTAAELFFGTATWRKFFSVDENRGLNALSTETVLFGMPLTRVGGILLEPINTGYVATSVVVVVLVHYFYSENSFGRLGVLSIGLCAFAVLFFTSTKNSILMFAVALICAILLTTKWLPLWATVLGSWLSAIFLTLIYIASDLGVSYIFNVWSNPIGTIAGDSSSVHMAGLVSGFDGLSDAPFGHGVGSGGNFAYLFDASLSWHDWLDSGGESSWGTLAFQAGVIAVAGLVILLGSLAATLGRWSTLLISVWSAAALFTEAFFGPISASVLLLSAGFVSVASVTKAEVSKQVADSHSSSKSRAEESSDGWI